ncbi:MAG: putative toxin-antitoxin system toxin component, PIN family [Planctomycetota bacterium]
MNVVVDTNVLVSAIFFSGTPGKILSAWRSGRITLIVSPLILHEYRRVASELSLKFKSVEIAPILDLITIHSEIVGDQTLSSPICRDADDDKFLACAAASRAVLVSGDKDLLAVDGALGVHVLTPRALITLLDR